MNRVSVKTSFIVATAFVAIIGGAVVVWLDRHTSNADYWLSGIGLVLPVVSAVAGKAWGLAKVVSAEELDKYQKELSGLVHRQWEEEVERWTTPYPLPVPFSAADGGTSPNRGARVMDSWAAILRDPAREAPGLDGVFDSIAKVFLACRDSGAPGRLVILGDSGTGKTTLAQALAVKLLADGQDPGGNEPLRPVPVVLPLMTWDPVDPLLTWAADQITRSYPWLGASTQVREGGVSTMAAQMIEQGRVLLVLDGLDEIAEKNQSQAFKKLSVAARRNQLMIITCQTKIYENLVNNSRSPLSRTPVIQLRPLPPETVCAYLEDELGEASDPGLKGILSSINDDPDSEIGEALRSPFTLWLLTTGYKDQALSDEDRDAALHKVTQCVKRDELMAILMKRLVRTIYSTEYPAEEGNGLPAIEKKADLDQAWDRLAAIARNLLSEEGTHSIDWWQMTEKVPLRIRVAAIAVPAGSVVGAAAGFAASSRFPVFESVWIGLAVGLMVTAVAGFARASSVVPNIVDLHFRWSLWRFVGCLLAGTVVGSAFAYADWRGGGLVPCLITALLVWPVSAIPCASAFSWRGGIEAGCSAFILFGLASWLVKGNGHPVESGVAVGLVFGVSGWVYVGLYQTTRDRFAAGPRVLHDRDRSATLIVSCVGGLMGAGVYGVALGPVDGMLALVALTVGTASVVSSWVPFVVAQNWLARNRDFPPEMMEFLDEACVRGALRQVGSSYQFRHMELMKALIRAAEFKAVPPPQPTTTAHRNQPDQTVGNHAAEAFAMLRSHLPEGLRELDG